MVNACVSEVYDLSTQTNIGTVLKVHTPAGQNIKRHLVGFFMQYKRYRYVGAKVTLVPASTLPADPLQVSMSGGEPTIDPRDMVNPILYKNYHGESMLTDQLAQTDLVPSDAGNAGHWGSSIYQNEYDNSGSGVALYNQTLMDDSFRKASVQRGFSIFVKPYVYNVASNYQISANAVHGHPMNTPRSQMYGVVEEGVRENAFITHTNMYGPAQYSDARDVWSNPGSLFTNKLTRLGWMDTTQNGIVYDNEVVDGTPAPIAPSMAGAPFVNALLPAVPMLYVLLPPAYKTEFYFRMVIKHYFQFGGFRSCFSVQSWGGYTQEGPTVTPVTSRAVASALASMVADSEGPPDSVSVEHGTLLCTADGASD